MPRWASLPRPFLLVAATLFAAAAILYGSLWMYVVRHPGWPVELGFDAQYSAPGQSYDVQRVQEASPAEQAGLEVRDRILAVNGQRLETTKPFDDVWSHCRPGDSVELTVERPGQTGTMILRGIFRASKPQSSEGIARASALQLTGSYPVPFLIVGLAVLFLRTDDRNAWLLALLFSGFIAVPGTSFATFATLSPALQVYAMVYRAIFVGMFAALFYLFFAVFPTRSPLDRRLPWLKWVGFALGACVTLPGLRAGDARAPAALIRRIGEHAASRVVLCYIYFFFALGIVSLVGNAFRGSTPEACRKNRVILWGTVVGVLPIAAVSAARDFAGFEPSFWLDKILIVVVFLFPLSFAYAVVKHRVMEIPVLLKRSARYLLVRRGFAVLIFLLAASVNAVFTLTFAHFFRMNVNFAMAVGVGFGIMLAGVSAPVLRRTTKRIDRAFFRSAYDARQILESLAEKIRTATDRDALATLLESEITDALHPISIAVYLESEDGRLRCVRVRGASGLEPLPPGLPLLRELARRGQPWDGPLTSADDTGDALTVFGGIQTECLVPMLGRDGRLAGLIVLGPRLSEEPYSGEDKRLLASAASQAGTAVESIRLAEKMAERMEAEHRAAHEMEIARQVQFRLFPQKLPPMRTLEYAGGCVQARQVGGDYYDFLDLGPGRIGMVLADIAGKGISGALLMANLQANLRSQYAVALDDLPRLLKSVNQLFFDNTADDSYATLFFADYADATRRLRYANCGHNPPLLLRANGTVERLAATTTVLGLFSVWECSTAEVELHPGDLLVIYTDGITEAANEQEEEFGAARLLETVRAHRDAPVRSLLEAINAAAQEFSRGAQADDLTLVVARAR